jgi:hypothetical protein
MNDFAEEFFGLVFIAIALTFFIIGFHAAFKVLAAKLPFPTGLQELLAA